MSASIQDRVLAAMPGTLAEVVERCSDLPRQVVWDTVKTLRQAGYVRRSGAKGGRTYAAVPKPEIEAAEKSDDKRDRNRRRPVVLFWIEGWPNQDPGRRMVWEIVYRSRKIADQTLARCVREMGHLANWEVVMMAPKEAYALRQRGYELRERLLREAAERAAVVTASSRDAPDTPAPHPPAPPA